jgi:Uma2 family endonuclease
MMATMPARTRSGDFTYDDFCTLVGDGCKGDLIDGVIYMASPENLRANDLGNWLTMVLRVFVRRRGLGRVFSSRVAYRLDNKNAPEPDVAFVSNANADRLRKGRVEGPPDFAIEIVSPESVERDYIKKRNQFERFGVPEYWIIDEDEQTVTILRLDAHGKYRGLRRQKGILRSQEVTDFWIDVNWLWQDPLPDEMETAQQILGATN